MFHTLRQHVSKYWPIWLIFFLTGIIFIYLLWDSRYFFYDDFTGFTFSLPRSYLQIVTDSLASKDIDRHKIVGYLLTKFLYHRVGPNVDVFFAVLWLIHFTNSSLLYLLLKRFTRHQLGSLVLSLVFAFKFYLWWWSNIHTLLAAFFGLITLHLWLNYLVLPRVRYLALIWLIFPLLIYSYGPGFFLYPALALIAVFVKGFAKSRPTLLRLLPFCLLLVGYYYIYTAVPDSLNRFSLPTGTYFRPLTLGTFINTQSQFLTSLNPYFPVSNLLVILTGLAFILLSLRQPRLFLPLVAFFITIAPNSFFPNHTMFYYLYFPIVFLLIYFASSWRTRFWLPAFILFLLVFYPFGNMYTILFRLKHPSPHFDKESMRLITQGIETALAKGSRQVQLSNWRVTPNLTHAIDSQAIVYFLSSPDADRYVYTYSRDTQQITLTPIQH